MFVILCELVIGTALLLFSADRFIAGASSLARRLGLSPLLIGLTIVSIGTSMPEIIITVVAAMHRAPGLVVGSAIGSNISNIGLGIGLIALCMPFNVRTKIYHQTYPILWGVMLLLGVLIFDGLLGRIDGILLTITFIAIMSWLIYQARDQTSQTSLTSQTPSTKKHSVSMTLLWLALGIVLLPLSAKIIVTAAVALSHYFGISELVVGLTVVAIGTSLPEIAISFIGILRKEYDISLGNIVGSNITNTLLVLGLPAMISPIPIPSIVFYRDYGAMLGLTMILFAVSYSHKGQGHINRLEGGILLLCYLFYLMIVCTSVTP